MHCPETIVFHSYRHPLMVVRHDGADYGPRRAPILKRLNPLRYEIVLAFKPTGGRRNYYLNRDAWMWRAWSDFWFRLRGANL